MSATKEILISCIATELKLLKIKCRVSSCSGGIKTQIAFSTLQIVCCYSEGIEWEGMGACKLEWDSWEDPDEAEYIKSLYSTVFFACGNSSSTPVPPLPLSEETVKRPF